jgi:hypothetical protein
MTTTYNSNLSTDKDRVRFLVKDTGVSGVWRFQDEEIQYYIGEEIALGTHPPCIQFEVAILLLGRILVDITTAGSDVADDVKRFEFSGGPEVEFGKGSWTEGSITSTIDGYRLQSARCANVRPNRFIRAMGKAPYVRPPVISKTPT